MIKGKKKKNSKALQNINITSLSHSTQTTSPRPQDALKFKWLGVKNANEGN